jgi:hypothetical protein
MRNFTSTGFKNYRAATFSMLFIFVTLFLSACSKKEEAVSASPYLSVINTSPTAGTFNVYLNDVQINTAALPFGGGIAYKQYNPGDYRLKFTTASAIESLLTKNITIANSSIYTFFLLDKGAKLDGLLVTDDFSGSATTKSYVRFINVSPDAPSLDVALTGKANLVTDKSYKAISGFMEVDPGTYTFDVKDHATGAVKATSESRVLVGGAHYTVLARGLMSETGTDNVFSAQVYENK